MCIANKLARFQSKHRCWFVHALGIIALVLQGVAGQPVVGQAPAATPASAAANVDEPRDEAHPLLRSASTAERWEANRAELVKRMQSIMGELPPKPAAAAPRWEVLSETDCGIYVRKHIRYLSEPRCWTPAYLCVPKQAADSVAPNEADTPLPAVLCLHPTDNVNGNKVVVGLGGRANRQYAAELAERGYVTLAPAYPLLADYQPDLEQLGWESGTLKAIWDNMRGVDLLQSLPYIDDQAIGAIGHSLGGHNAVYTAVFDPRIRVIVSSCGLDSYRDYYGGDRANWEGGRGWTSQRYMPRLAQYQDRLSEIPFDFHEMIAALAPRATLIVAPLHDSNFRPESVDKIARAARPIFELYGAGEALRIAHPDCDHDFPPEQRQRAYELFDQVLDRG
ncbi:alpha/beta hydrolase [Roseimaritima sediminicola]|uniref:alpha/beta hydrolase n=1 Tax=Roseimaritima sediminicola TaxID=2662066 RepID=UPI00129838A1|nr:prolyl oligopeptidase family serine peptidase [Roseimaritima sediminicola]